MVIPDRMLQTKTTWVQECMIGGYTTFSKIVKKLQLPPYFAVGTSLSGTSNLCDVYRAASEGCKNVFPKLELTNIKLFPLEFPILII